MWRLTLAQMRRSLGRLSAAAVAVAIGAAFLAATLIAEVLAVTLLQRAAPEDLIARVFGVYDQLNVGAIAVGSLIAGPLADRLGAGTAIVVVAGCCLVGSMLATGAMPASPSRTTCRSPSYSNCVRRRALPHRVHSAARID